MFDQRARLRQPSSNIPHPALVSPDRAERNPAWDHVATRVQTKAAPGKPSPGATAGGDREADLHRALTESRPLPNTVRHEFEPRLGFDLSHVRISTGQAAARAARAIHARAFTVGHTIVFGEGEYQPHSTEGKHLIAHELAHVIQQTAPPRHKSAHH